MKLKLTLLFLIVFVANAVNAQEFDYLPRNVTGNQVLQYSEFTLSYNEAHEQAEWVAYKLTRSEVELDLERCDDFETDHNVISASASERDYVSTGFDKGHLAPSADIKANRQANCESFLMSNISPQIPYFNQDYWALLEEWVRDQARTYETVYVVTGPVFVNNLGKIGRNEVTIPGYFYKALLRFQNGNPRMIGFLIPHVGAQDSFKNYVVPINTIETLTGLDFFPALGSRENYFESQTYESSWHW